MAFDAVGHRIIFHRTNANPVPVANRTPGITVAFEGFSPSVEMVNASHLIERTPQAG